MTLIQKIDYLLSNNYTQEGEGVNRKFYSYDKSKKFSIRDLLNYWNGLIVF